MKKKIIGALVLFAGLSYGQATPLELWTYTGVPDGPLSAAISETPTGSAFGTGASFLTVDSEAAYLTTSGASNENYAEGLSPATYAGLTTGVYQISYTITEANFFSTVLSGGTKGQFGWGLRSNVGDDCNVLFQYNAKTFELVVNDDAPPRDPVKIADGFIIYNVTIRQVYILGANGNPGSFQVYYSLDGAEEQEVYSGDLKLHSDFRLDEFRMEINTTANGFSWRPGSRAIIDNLSFEELDSSPELALIGHSISFIKDNGTFTNKPSIYEPGDVLQVVTTNKNIGFGLANNVTTTLSADPSAFSITPITNTTASLNINESYPASFEVKVLNGALDGDNTFTVINTIGAGTPAPMVFKDEF